MNKKLSKVLDEIQRTEEKIAEWQEHLQELNILRKQLEEREIVKSFRSLKLQSRQMLEILTGIQNGTIPLADFIDGKFGSVQESEKKGSEKVEEEQTLEAEEPQGGKMHNEEI